MSDDDQPVRSEAGTAPDEGVSSAQNRVIRISLVLEVIAVAMLLISKFVVPPAGH